MSVYKLVFLWLVSFVLVSLIHNKGTWATHDDMPMSALNLDSNEMSNTFVFFLSLSLCLPIVFCDPYADKIPNTDNSGWILNMCQYLLS